MKINEDKNVVDTNHVMVPTIKLINPTSGSETFTYKIQIIDDFEKSYEIYKYFLDHFDDIVDANTYLTSATFYDVTDTSITITRTSYQ